MSSDRYEDNAMRKNDVIFAFRGLQVIFVISILGVAGNDASTWSDIECSIPAKLAYNIAAAALSLPIVIYLFLTTGPLAKTFKFLPWNPWLQFSADILLILFWLTTGGVISSFGCSDACSACGGFYYGCYCGGSSSEFTKRKSSGSSLADEVYKVADKIGLDWTMFLLVLVTLVMTCYLLWRQLHPKPEEEHVENVVVETKTDAGPVPPQTQVPGEMPYTAPPQPPASQVPTMGAVHPGVQATPAYQAPISNAVPEYQGPVTAAQNPTPEYHA